MKLLVVLTVTSVLAIALIPVMLDRGYTWYVYLGAGYPSLIVLGGVFLLVRELVGRGGR